MLTQHLHLPSHYQSPIASPHHCQHTTTQFSSTHLLPLHHRLPYTLRPSVRAAPS
ncbi:hypothetical protein EX30DRAFT_340682 [Ascodesmis nigricans]|uniref:Uncharacterized protein n=1 Tax=Ascodesmis nigricans TaxID=341454 RepID=A0A4S2MXM7_9PEZI|nr:hypothetical protein EX30DRAFT_340682 [Ascodesmis nigricans]